MASVTVEGLVSVFESSDGGTGDPTKTTWQFFVAGKSCNTKNHSMAETVRLAVYSNTPVRVIFDDATGDTILQVRMEFEYACETKRVNRCNTQPT
jgi:hypothetical protein